ncbi:hypothetical protein BDW59DRAFT_157683 [Aspergillus cavernicola]|uniref:F-box domain protein n=1 Tax=Aspergillus cavernicola TaxID=176166 RepID=A0ABR4IY12_9EURO
MPPRKRHQPDSTTEELFAVSKRTRRGAVNIEDERGLYKVLQRKGFSFRLLDLPFEVRQLIYRFALGYRTIHVEYFRKVHPEYYQVHWHYWKYFVCKCDVATSAPRSEYAVGEIWAGENEPDNFKGGKNAKAAEWRHTVPACEFKDFDHRDVSIKMWRPRDQTIKEREKLHLNLLRANKQVYSEAKDIPYVLNIFAFQDVKAFKRFISNETGLLATQLGLIRNIVIHIQPQTTETARWNRWLVEEPGALDALKGLRKLQIVVENPNPRRVDLNTMVEDWTELCLVYGFLVFAKLGIREVSVDVSLCQAERKIWRNLGEKELAIAREGEKDAVAYARMLEAKLLRPWSEEIRLEMKTLREQSKVDMGDRYLRFDDGGI